LIYAADEWPGVPSALGLGIQHAVLSLGLTAYVLVVARLAHLSTAETHTFLVASILALAVGTVLQAWGGRLGAGALLVHAPNPFVISLVVPAIAVSGPGALIPIGITAGIVSVSVSRIVPRLRAVFPPIVAGLVILMGGMTLVKGAVRHSLALDASSVIHGPSAMVALVTVTTIMVLSIWGSRRAKLFGLIIGIAVGVVTAQFLGVYERHEELEGAPYFALPTFTMPAFDVDPAILVGIAVVALLTQLDTLGGVIMMDKMEDADWRRGDMTMVGRGIQASGMTDFIGGLLGGMPSGASSANIGLCHASRATTRYAGLAAGLILLAIAFLPQVTLLIVCVPSAVIGAVELYAAAYLIAAGADLVATRALDSRGIFIVGLSLCLGLAVLLFPDLAVNAPESIRFLVGNSFVVTGVSAVTLNLLFRIGTKARATQDLRDGDGPVADLIVDFVESQGGIWAARREVVKRAAQAAVEAAEAIEAAGHDRRVTAIAGSFDEINLDLRLYHTGPPLALDAEAPRDLTTVLDGADDDALDAAVAAASAVMIRHLADRQTTGTDGPVAYLRLHFDH